MTSLAVAQESPLDVAAQPVPAYIERTDTAQLLNFDFIIVNKSDETWTVREIELSAYDSSGMLEFRRLLNDNGNSPGIETLNKRSVSAGQRILIFNPFFSLGNEFQLTTLVYRFSWRAGKDGREVSVESTVRPESYSPQTSLRLPLRGRFIVWDGHDYYSHHRRFDYLMHSQETGTNSNLDRYGHDFVPVNEAGEMRHGRPDDNSSWFGFGQPIFAAGAGQVLAAVDDGLDNREVDRAKFEANKLADYGNYIVIDHGGGEFALYGHIRQASAVVKPGDVVKAGQQIAAIGASGSSLMPHLHFQLQSTSSADGEGLPSYFGQFVRLLGRRSLSVPRGPVDSGDIVEDTTGPR